MLSLGRRFFALSEDERLQLHCADGVRFMAEASAEGRKFDVLMVDVADTSGPGAGDLADTGSDGCLAVPPASFLSSAAVQAASCCLGGAALLLKCSPSQAQQC